MNSNKLAGLLNKLPGFLIILFLISCNPYRTVIRQPSAHEKAGKILDILENNYPFSAHKSIDWERYSNELSELLQEPYSASKYLNIRELIYQIPDARINLTSPDDNSLLKSDLGGYAGFDLFQLPDGSTRVIKIDSSSAAFQRGLRIGDRIAGWNGTAISEVLEEKKLRWGLHPATPANYRIFRDHFMTRGPVGTSLELFYESASGNSRGIRIPFEKTEPVLVPDYLGIPETNKPGFNEFYRHEKLGVWTLSDFSPASQSRFLKNIVPQLSALDGLIIDLRENRGGYDGIAAQIASYFISENRQYEETLIRDVEEGSWQDLGIIESRPNPQFTFQKPVILIIGPLCNGSGEGFARLLLLEENIQSLGLWNTAGSFSYPGGNIKLPGKFSLYYPIGMSLDEEGSIVLESSGAYGGGIYPDIRIPVNLKILAQLAAGQDVMMDEAIFHLGR